MEIEDLISIWSACEIKYDKVDKQLSITEA